MSISLADSIARSLSTRGVRRIFGVPGGGSSLALIDAAAEVGIEFILCRTETAAAIMAAVTGELTDIPGVVLTGIGPGAASAVNGIAYASLERAPVILISDTNEAGASAPPHQIFDQQALFAPISKAQHRLTPADGGQSFNALFDLAAAEPPGPVHIDLSARDADAMVTEVQPSSPGKPREIDDESLQKVVALIAACRRPVLIVGHQCRAAERALAANQLAKSLGGPVMTTYKAKGTIGDSNPLTVGSFTGAKLDASVLEEADLILFCGVDPVEIIPGKWRYAAPVAVLTEYGNLAWPFAADAMVEGSIAESAARLAKKTPAVTWEAAQITRLKQRIQAKLGNVGKHGHFPDNVVDALALAAPAGARLAVDAGAHMFSAMNRWPASRPYDVLKSNGLSSMGYALPAALAGWLQQPERHAIALTGDGGMMMSLAELSTAARLGAALTVVVLNDAALSLIDIKQQRQQRASLGVRYPAADFAAAARGMGCTAWTVGPRESLPAALSAAFSTKGPGLIDVTLNPSGYREQLIALRG